MQEQLCVGDSCTTKIKKKEDGWSLMIHSGAVKTLLYTSSHDRKSMHL